MTAEKPVRDSVFPKRRRRTADAAAGGTICQAQDKSPRKSSSTAPRKISRTASAACDGAAGAATNRRELIARLVTRIEAEIAAVEKMVAGKGGVGEVVAERAARTLAVLVRALRELAALDRNQSEEDADDADERDADAFRRELGDTLERVLAGRSSA